MAAANQLHNLLWLQKHKLSKKLGKFYNFKHTGYYNEFLGYINFSETQQNIDVMTAKFSR